VWHIVPYRTSTIVLRAKLLGPFITDSNRNAKSIKDVVEAIAGQTRRWSEAGQTEADQTGFEFQPETDALLAVI
jgi:hypothetical protein